MTPLEAAQAEITNLRRAYQELQSDYEALRRERNCEGFAVLAPKIQAASCLAPQEAQLLALLYQAKRPMRRWAVNEAVPAQDGHTHDGDRADKIVDVWLSRLRLKIGYDTVRTIRGGWIEITPLGVEQVERALAGGRIEAPANNRGGLVLSTDQAREILALKGKFTAAEIAPRYGCSPSLVYNIWSGRRWTGVGQAA